MEPQRSASEHTDHSGSNGAAPARPTGRISTASSAGTAVKLVVVAVIVLIALGVGFGIQWVARQHHEKQVQEETSQAADAVQAVDVVTAQPIAATYPLSLPGQTAGFYESTIYARVDGYVGKWFSDIGDRVKAGQVLATIETPDLDQQLAAAEARVIASIAQVTVAKSTLSIAKITYDRWQGSPKGVVAEEDKDQKKAAYDTALAQVDAAQAQHRLDEADVNRLKALEEFKKVEAPYDGVITSRHIDIGDLVTAGSTASTSSLYAIAQSSTIRTFVNVPQKAAIDMVDGLGADVTSEQVPDHVFHGSVTRSTHSIDPQTRTQKTEVDLENKDLVLRPGMYVQVTFQLKQKGLLQVPAAAILFKPSGLQVAVIDVQGKVQFRPITVAQDNGETVELKSGVSPGERVALNMSNNIAAGDTVTVVNVDDQFKTPPATPAPPATQETASRAP